jgi:serine/threonine protein kinase
MYESALLNEGTNKYILILMELCTGGHLIDLLQKFDGKLSEQQIVFILRDICA